MERVWAFGFWGPAVDFGFKVGLADFEKSKRYEGFVTFAHFTCQHRCALKDRSKENQSLGALDVGAKSTENGLFLASVTMPFAPLSRRVRFQILKPHPAWR